MVKKLLVIFSALLIFPLGAVPFTTLGEIKTPTAHVLPHLTMEASTVGYYSSVSKDVDPELTYAGVINLGLFDRGEIGFVMDNNSLAYANVKLNVLQENEFLPAIAVGVDNLFCKVKDTRDDEGKPGKINDFNLSASDLRDITDPDDYIRNSVYVAVTKSTILRGLPMINFLETNMTLGLGKGRFEGNEDVAKQLGGLFAGLEFKPLNNFSILAEMDGYNANFGVKYKYRNFVVRAALYRAEEMDNQDPKIALNVKYVFDNLANVKFADAEYAGSYSSREYHTPGTRLISRKGEVLEENPVMNELDDIRQRREKAQKELEEIKRILEQE